MARQVLIIGGGITGMQTAHVLGSLGIPSLLIERGDELGGHVLRLSRTFPFFNDDGFRDGKEFATSLEHDIRANPLTQVRLGTTLASLEGEFPFFRAVFHDGGEARPAAIVVATGFEPYDPTELHEYGYGVLANVVTALDLEWLLNPRGPTMGELLRPGDRKRVDRLAIVFCVGSRNRRIGAPFCSRICCSYSTKQAVHVRERNPQAQVACFYMDVRTYDRGFEEMYANAQDHGVTYVRGRVSSVQRLPDSSLAVRCENTLLGRPFYGEFDMVSLSTGMRPGRDAEALAQALGIARAPDGFLMSRSWFRFPQDSTREGIFVAGCATGMKPIRNCMGDGAAVAARVASVLRQVGGLRRETDGG
jgi:heterodisulfide reductase subunit A-like polyferredoxin